ncbi:MAG: DNA polymerase III subunit delta [Cyclobacteriaceae bacterium]
MDAQALKILNQIKMKKPAPVYFLQGDEVYFIDLISDAIESSFLEEHEKGFNQIILYGAETSVAAILGNARRFPMMSDFQVVIIKEAQDLSDLYKEPGAAMLLDYFSKPVPSTVLVFCHKHKSLDKRKEFGKKAEQSGFVHTFKKLPDYKLPDFVSEYFTAKGFRIDEAGAQIVAEYVGNDLNRITHEADKVMISREKGFSFTAAIIMAQVGISREYNIFELQKAVITKNFRKAYSIVRYFQANPKRNPGIPCVAFLYAFFSRLLVASSLSDRSSKSLTLSMKMSPMMANDYSTALGNYNAARIRENIGLIREADLKLKGFGAPGDDEGQILQELIFRIMN